MNRAPGETLDPHTPQWDERGRPKIRRAKQRLQRVRAHRRRRTSGVTHRYQHGRMATAQKAQASIWRYSVYWRDGKRIVTPGPGRPPARVKPSEWLYGVATGQVTRHAGGSGRIHTDNAIVFDEAALEEGRHELQKASTRCHGR